MAEVRSSRVRLALIVAGVAIASLMYVPAANAGFINGFTGSTTLVSGVGGNTANGIINYAVFQNTGNDWLGAFGLNGNGAAPAQMAIALSGAINTTDMYVYLYQIVDTDANNNLAQLKATFPNPATSITSIGYFNARVFLNATGPVGPAGNQTLGNALVGSGTTSSLPQGAALFNAGAANPNSGNNQASITWTTQITPGGFSSIVFVTSNIAPTFQPGSIKDNNGGISVAAIPGVAVPEPSSIVLVLSGGALLLGLRRRRGATQAL